MATDGAPEPGHTTERIDPAYYLSTRSDAFLYACHLASYDFVLDLARDRRVLDFGCGTGYGTARLADAAASIIGVDVSPEVIDVARDRFDLPGLDFRTIRPVEAEPLPFADGAFDVVLSFQVYEHLVDPSAYLAEAVRVLAADGTLVCITPDRDSRLLPRQRPWNRFHVREYSQSELRADLEPHFGSVEVAGMSADAGLLQLELRRYRRVKWLAAPVTFPGVPEAVRTRGLRALQRLDRRRGAVAVESASGRMDDFGVGPEDVDVFTTRRPSLHVVAVARAPRRAQVRTAPSSSPASSRSR